MFLTQSGPLLRSRGTGPSLYAAFLRRGPVYHPEGAAISNLKHRFSSQVLHRRLKYRRLKYLHRTRVHVPPALHGAPLALSTRPAAPAATHSRHRGEPARGHVGLSDPDIDCGYRARSAGAACGLQQTLLGQAPLGFAGGCCLCQSRDSKWTRERVQAEGTVGAHTEKCGGGTGRAPCGSMNISLEQRDVGDRNEFVPKQCWCISAARQPRGWGC